MKSQEERNKELIDLTRRLAKDSGCTCEPDITLVPTDIAGFYQARVAQDDWCVLILLQQAAMN